jgi:alpha-tubulin suppressor-like RCC1 family protein
VALILQEGPHSTVWELNSSAGLQKVPGLPEQSSAVFTQVSRGLVHAAAVTSDGTLFTWGFHRYGVQRGAGERVATVSGQDMAMVACGQHFVIALARSGQVSLSGLVPYFNQQADGFLENSLSLTYQRLFKPVDSAAFHGEPIAMVSAGTQHFLVVSSSGLVFSWGRSHGGCLGHGDTHSHVRPKQIAPTGFGGEPVRVVCAFDNASMAITRGGVLYACGNNASNVLGLPDSAGVDVLAPVRVGGADVFEGGVLCVSGSASHALAVSRAGLLFACGNSICGALGLGPSTETVETFVQIEPARFQWNLIVSASAGNNLSVAISEVGALFVWGCGARDIKPLLSQKRACSRVCSIPFLHDQYPYGNYHELSMGRVLAFLMGTHPRLGNWTSAEGKPLRASRRLAGLECEAPPPPAPRRRSQRVAGHSLPVPRPDSILLRLPAEIMQAVVRACAHWQHTSDAVEVLMGGGLRRP